MTASALRVSSPCMAMQATNIATNNAKDNQHEMPMLGDHIYLTTTAEVIIQSHKEGVLSYHFWAENMQEVISNRADTEGYYATAARVQLAQKTH